MPKRLRNSENCSYLIVLLLFENNIKTIRVFKVFFFNKITIKVLINEINFDLRTVSCFSYIFCEIFFRFIFKHSVRREVKKKVIFYFPNIIDISLKSKINNSSKC